MGKEIRKQVEEVQEQAEETREQAERNTTEIDKISSQLADLVDQQERTNAQLEKIVDAFGEVRTAVTELKVELSKDLAATEKSVGIVVAQWHSAKWIVGVAGGVLSIVLATILGFGVTELNDHSETLGAMDASLSQLRSVPESVQSIRETMVESDSFDEAVADSAATDERHAERMDAIATRLGSVETQIGDLAKSVNDQGENLETAVTQFRDARTDMSNSVAALREASRTLQEAAPVKIVAHTFESSIVTEQELQQTMTVEDGTEFEFRIYLRPPRENVEFADATLRGAPLRSIRRMTVQRLDESSVLLKVVTDDPDRFQEAVESRSMQLSLEFLLLSE